MTAYGRIGGGTSHHGVRERRQAATYPRSVRAQLWSRVEHVLHEVAKFGVVGAFAYVIDVGLFNLLRFAGGPDAALHDKPLTAKAISAAAATTFAYFANRHWTFRHRGRSGLAREFLLFAVLNGVGLAISLGCLSISHYVLDLRSPLADNVSANVVGLVLGTLFRFWSYRRFVFRDATVPAITEPADVPAAVAADVQSSGP